MEEDWESVFYFYLEKGKSAKRNILSSWKPESRTVDMGEERVCFCQVPEYYVGKKCWDMERLRGLLQKQLEESDVNGYYVEPELGEMLALEEKLPPLFLLKKVLCQNGCWENLIYVGCEEGGDSYFAEEREEEILFSLLTEYLPRINHFTVVTAKPKIYQHFMDYIYEEYGIPAACGAQLKERFCKGKKTTVLDGRPRYRVHPDILPENATYIDLWSEKEKHNRIKARRRDVTCLDAVIFLDTLVKNGYNTIVNRTINERTVNRDIIEHKI